MRSLLATLFLCVACNGDTVSRAPCIVAECSNDGRCCVSVSGAGCTESDWRNARFVLDACRERDR